jgi:hypothetical protein
MARIYAAEESIHVRCDVTQRWKRCCKRRSLWVSDAPLDTQLCSKQISGAVNQYATIGEVVFSADPPEANNEDLTQL